MWDLDGTLIDSKQSICDCLAATLAAHGHQFTASQLIAKGLPLKDLIHQSIPHQLTQKEIVDIINSFKFNYDHYFCVRTEIFPQIKCFLQKYSSQELCIATNKRRFPTIKILQALFSNYNIKGVCCIDDLGVACKADMIHTLVKNNSWDRDTVIYVGDSYHDAQSATSAGVESILVDWGKNDLKFLLNKLNAKGFKT